MQDSILKLFQSRLSIVSIGIARLIEHLHNYDVNLVQVDWKPPAGGNPEMLKKLRSLMK